MITIEKGIAHTIEGTKRNPIEIRDANPSFPYFAMNGGLMKQITLKSIMVDTPQTIVGTTKYIIISRIKCHSDLIIVSIAYLKYLPSCLDLYIR